MLWISIRGMGAVSFPVFLSLEGKAWYHFHEEDDIQLTAPNIFSPRSIKGPVWRGAGERSKAWHGRAEGTSG